MNQCRLYASISLSVALFVVLPLSIITVLLTSSKSYGEDSIDGIGIDPYGYRYGFFVPIETIPLSLSTDKDERNKMESGCAKAALLNVIKTIRDDVEIYADCRDIAVKEAIDTVPVKDTGRVASEVRAQIITQFLRTYETVKEQCQDELGKSYKLCIESKVEELKQ